MATFSGMSPVTQGALHIKDRSVMPPDRPIFPYRQRQADGTVKDVVGTWGDYLRDLDNGIAVDPSKTPVATEANNPDGTMLITNLYQGIPDRASIPNPLLPY
jgi:hypothetical protein